jgi:hypothetical protein
MTTPMMVARRMGLGRNPLRRGSDRLEVAVLWIGLVVSLMLMPVSAAIGTSIAERDARMSAATRSAGAQVIATTLDAVPITPASSVAVTMPVLAVWSDATGQQRTGVVQAPQGSRAGTPIRVWVDGSGQPVEAPTSPGVSAFVGTMTGITAFVGGLASIWFLVWLARYLLDRWRYHQWQTEWRGLSTHSPH